MQVNRSWLLLLSKQFKECSVTSLGRTNSRYPSLAQPRSQLNQQHPLASQPLVQITRQHQPLVSHPPPPSALAGQPSGVGPSRRRSARAAHSAARPQLQPSAEEDPPVRSVPAARAHSSHHQQALSALPRPARRSVAEAQPSEARAQPLPPSVRPLSASLQQPLPRLVLSVLEDQTLVNPRSAPPPRPQLSARRRSAKPPAPPPARSAPPLSVSRPLAARPRRHQRQQHPHLAEALARSAARPRWAAHSEQAGRPARRSGPEGLRPARRLGPGVRPARRLVRGALQAPRLGRV